MISCSLRRSFNISLRISHDWRMDLVMRIGGYGAIFVARSYLTSEEDCRNSGADVCGEGCVAEVILAFPIIIILGGGLVVKIITSD